MSGYEGILIGSEHPMEIQTRERTTVQDITKAMHLLKKPGCSLNEAVMPKAHTITSLLPEKRVKKLQEAWPMLESALHEYDVTCILDPL